MSTAGVKVRRYFLLGAAALVVLVLLLLTIVSLALYTEAGSRRVTQALLERANTQDGINLQTGSISGNLLSGLTLTDLAIDIPAAQVTAESVRASWNPWSLLSGSFYLGRLDFEALTITLPEVTDTASTPTDPLSLLRIEALPINIAIGAFSAPNITIVMPDQTLTISDFSMSGSLNGLDLTIEDLHGEAMGAIVDLSLQATLRDDIPLLASVNWEYQGTLFADYELAVGTAAVTGDLNNLRIQHELKAPEVLHSAGFVRAPLSAEDLSLEFTHSTESLRLPFDGIADYLFENVALATNWDNATLDLELQTAVSGAMLPAAQLNATGTLTGTVLQLTAASLSTATGTLTATGELDLADPFTSAFDFSLTEQVPLQYLTASIPVELVDLTASGSVNLAFVNDEVNLDLLIDDFNGMTSGYELSGEAALSVVGAAVQIEHLRLSTIANEILVTGEYRDEIHLQWQLAAPELAQLLTGITGAATGNGRIDGPLDNPAISATLQVQQLQSEIASVETISISVEGTLEQLQGNVLAEDIAFAADSGAPRIASLSLQASGNSASHSLQAELESEYGAASISVTGGMVAPSTPLWEGNLNAASLRSEFGNWDKQAGATALALSPGAVQIADTCWQLEATELCFGIEQSTATELAVSATLANFPLPEFNSNPDSRAPLIPYSGLPRLPPGITLDGTLAAALDGVLSLDGSSPQLNFEVTANDTVLHIASTELVDDAIVDELVTLDGQNYSWSTLTVNGQWLNNNWTLEGNAALSQQNVEGTSLGLNGTVDGSLEIDANSNLAGTLIASFAELGWIQAFLPELTDVSGSLTGELGISGTIAAPLFAGDLLLNDGSATISQLGITLAGAQSSIVVENSGAVQIEGALASENGMVTFTGNITNLYDSTRSLQATLSGSNFLVADIEDLKLELSPDLSLTANGELIRLNGSLDIPVLDLTLLQLPETAVDVSRDTVIVSYPEDRPELGRSIAANQSMLLNIPVTADINLTLGDAVRVAGFGMEVLLDGALAIQQREDGSNLTYGELNIVEGEYSIYGQTLNLSEGKLLFFGAVDNPALDIRATREVEGVTVGVLMNGTLKNIRSQLFSTPVLPENDIIAVLVTGRPASELGEQDGTAVLGAIANLGLDRGQGLTDQIRNTLGLDTFGINTSGDINSSMLTLGKYLTPDIFVRYGVGLFDRQSKVAIDYSLSERIILQAESGEYQSIDLTYTLER